MVIYGDEYGVGSIALCSEGQSGVSQGYENGVEAAKAQISCSRIADNEL